MEGLDINRFTCSHYAELVQWFKEQNDKILIFSDSVAMIQSIGATHTLNDSLRAQ